MEAGWRRPLTHSRHEIVNAILYMACRKPRYLSRAQGPFVVNGQIVVALVAR